MDDVKKSYGSVENEDTIEITLEDLEDMPVVETNKEPKKIYGKVTEVDTIEITWDDLNTPDKPKHTSIYGTVPNYASGMNFEKSSKKIHSQSLVYPAIIGLLGGFLAFAINEPFTNDVLNEGNSLADMGLFLGIIGALISGALSCVEDVKSFVLEKAAKHFFSGVFVGFVTGFVGGIIAQTVFGVMTSKAGGLLFWLARIIGWAIAGTFVGLSQSIVDFKFNKKRLINGLAGGAIGGTIGGILFDPISIVLGMNGTHGGALSRCVGISVMGASIGCAIGYISETLKEAWIYIVDGPLKGKQFILYEEQTSFGSSPKCNITIVKDISISPIHFIVENHNTYYALIPQSKTYINGIETSVKNLRDGDIITAGHTNFRYEEKSFENKVK